MACESTSTTHPVRTPELELTDRLCQLVGFLVNIAPKIGETAEGHQEEVDCPEEIYNARHKAVLAAFEAVERIADATRPGSYLG